MATQSRNIRRGLPRVEGGDPWPAAGQAPARIVTAAAAAPSAPVSGVGSVTAGPAPAAARRPRCCPGTGTGPAAALSAPAPPVNAGAAVARQLRRGLPRVPGGEPWPPAGEVSVSVPARSGATAAVATPAPAADAAADAAEKAEPAATSAAAAPATAPAAPAPHRRWEPPRFVAGFPGSRAVNRGRPLDLLRRLLPPLLLPRGAGGSRTHCPGPCPCCQRGGGRCRGGAAGGPRVHPRSQLPPRPRSRPPRHRQHTPPHRQQSPSPPKSP